MLENYARVNGVNLHYVEEGMGELVILLHGFPDFWYGWRKQIPILSKLYRVVAPDMRGYNLSDKPTSLKDYHIDVLAADIAELIKRLGCEKAFIVGHDWGGAIAWTLAAQYPDLVQKVAILNCPHPREFIAALRKGNFTQWKKSWYMFFFQIPKLPEQFIGRNMRKFFTNIFENDSVEKYVEAFGRPQALTSALNYYRANFQTRKRVFSETASPLLMPVLMLWGEKDVALGKELTLNTQKYCRDLKIFYAPESGHFIQIDNPEFVNQKLLEFFHN